jgi:hypothetical protein
MFYFLVSQKYWLVIVAFFITFFSETQLLHPGFTACIAYQNTDLTVSWGTLQVMYDAFGVRLHAGKQAKVWQAFYVAATDRQNNEVVTQIGKW